MSNIDLKQLDIFTVPLWSSNLKNHNEIKDSLLDFLDDAKKQTPNRTIDHWNVFETSRDIHNHPSLDNFIKELSSFGSFIKKSWSLDETSNVSIVNMWATITDKNGIIMPHTVPNSTLYGLYFLRTPPDSGNLSIEHPVNDTSFFYSYIPTQALSFNTKRFVTAMPEGSIVLFPSYLKTSITPNLSDENRYIIHFSIKLS